MSFAIFADSTCNLPCSYLEKYQITSIPFAYEMDGKLVTCPQDVEAFDGKAYYDYLRAKGVVKTSLLSAGTLMDAFRPVLEAGQDILYTTLSAGISGTVNSAIQAARLLAEEFPERTVKVVDSMGAGLGTGLLVLKEAQYRAEGCSLEETAAKVMEDRDHLCQLFTVDDLMFLKRGGRVSGVSAAIGTLLQVKPLLQGDETGHISMFHKVRGRKKAMEALAELYGKRVTAPETQEVFISHGDCLEDAQTLAQLVSQTAQPKTLTILPHEPLTGAHVGPGMLALFFFGTGR